MYIVVYITALHNSYPYPGHQEVDVKRQPAADPGIRLILKASRQYRCSKQYNRTFSTSTGDLRHSIRCSETR